MQRSMLSVNVILLSRMKSYKILEVRAFLRPSRAECRVFALQGGKQTVLVDNYAVKLQSGSPIFPFPKPCG